MIARLILFIASLYGFHAGVVEAAEIKVLCTQAMTEAMAAIVPAFERSSGHHVLIAYGTTGGLVGRIEHGEPADVVILAANALGRLTTVGRLGGERVEVARGLVGLAIPSGAPRPDIGSAEALKSFLLSTKAIAYPNPSSGGASGIAFAHALDKLGIADAVRGKVRLVAGGASVGELAARGETEVAVQMVSELKPVAGIQVIGPLPGGLQSATVFSAAFGLLANEPAAAREFVAYLDRPESAAALAASGLEPVGR